MPQICQNLYYNLTREQEDTHAAMLAAKADLDSNLQSLIALQETFNVSLWNNSDFLNWAHLNSAANLTLLQAAYFLKAREVFA